MLVSQRSAHVLQQQLSSIHALEQGELNELNPPDSLKCFNNIFVNPGDYDAFIGEYAEYRNKVIAIRAKYNHKRKRLLWWHLYKLDVFVAFVVLVIVCFGVYFLLG